MLFSNGSLICPYEYRNGLFSVLLRVPLKDTHSVDLTMDGISVRTERVVPYANSGDDAKAFLTLRKKYQKETTSLLLCALNGNRRNMDRVGVSYSSKIHIKSTNGN